MRIRHLLLITGILLLYIASHYLPHHAQVILLLGNTRVDLSLTVAITALLIASLLLHWSLSVGFWITRIPKKIQDYRKNKAVKKQQQYREDGITYWLQNNLNQAQYLFAYAGKENTNKSDIDYLCAAYCALYKDTPEPDEASTYLHHVKDDDKTIAQKKTLQAKNEQIRGKYHLAMEYLSNIPTAKKTPLSEALQERLLIDTQQWQEAEKHLENLIHKSPKKISAWLTEKVMQQHLIHGHPQKAIVLFESLPLSLRNNTRLFTHYAHALHDTQQTDLALDRTLDYLNKNPSLDILSLITDFCSIHENKLQETIQKLLTLEKKDPENAFIAITLGKLLLHTQHFEQAQESFSHAINVLEKQQQSPELAEIATPLLLICLKQKNHCLERQRKQNERV